MQKRSYYLDWVRVVSIGLVFLFHCGRFFDHEDWHVKNNATSELATQAIFFMSRWIMPLFFFISGASTWFALHGKTPGSFSKSRLKRIAVPLIFGILALSPPQVYLERLSHHQFAGSFFEFLPHYFEGWYAFGGNFAWMGLHLWYLLLLLVFSLAGLPLFRLYRKYIPQGLKATPITLILCMLVLTLTGTFLDPDGIIGNRMWGGWSMVEHFVVFMMGFMLFSDAGLALRLEKRRHLFLVAAIVLSMAVMIPNPVSALSYGEPWYAAKMLIRTAHCMSCVFTILGFAHLHLNSGGSRLKKLNESVLPFYILHQAVMVPVGYYVVNPSWMMAIKYLVTAATSFAVILLVYAVIRRSNALRFVFGMSSRTGSVASQIVKRPERELASNSSGITCCQV